MHLQLHQEGADNNNNELHDATGRSDHVSVESTFKIITRKILNFNGIYNDIQVLIYLQQTVHQAVRLVC